MLDGTLPQVLARLLVVKAKHKGVLLRYAVVVVCDHDEGEFLFLKVEFDDILPEEEADILRILKDEYAGGSHTEAVIATVFALEINGKILA